MFYGYCGYPVLMVINTVDHAVITTAGAAQPLEPQLQRLTDAVGICGKRAIQELDYRSANPPSTNALPEYRR